jgi:hypothetical protein
MGGKPQGPESADITFTAKVHADQLRFDEIPETNIEFTGVPAYDSASGSDRTNLPEHVEQDVTYRDVWVDYRLAAKLIYPPRY